MALAGAQQGPTDNRGASAHAASAAKDVVTFVAERQFSHMLCRIMI
jgi:hypothetical protein